MSKLVYCSVGAFALASIAACGADNSSQSEVPATTITTETQGNAAGLADVQAEIDKAPEAVPADMVDPAAKNINPFRGLFEEGRAKEIEAAMKDTTADITADERLEEARAVLVEGAPSADTENYETALTCAAHYDAAGRLGALPAHEAQSAAKTVMSGPVFGAEQLVRTSMTEDEAEAYLETYRSTSYQAYLAMRADLMEAAEEPEAVLEQADACAEPLGFIRTSEPVDEAETSDSMDEL